MADSRMELFIETLTGTAFELSCSPLETINSIKSKIQYSEGIPVSQQHLIWKSQELSDHLCLRDYSINDGATLKLVLGMRVGPINTRQVPDTKKLKDIAEFVERNSESSGSGGRPLTVLVFYDGDKVNMFTLVEKGECTVSSPTSSISETSSIASVRDTEEVDADIGQENRITREKITRIQEQLRTLNIDKKPRGSAHKCFLPSLAAGEPCVREDSTFRLPPISQGAPQSIHMTRKAPKGCRNDPLLVEGGGGGEGGRRVVPATSSTPPSALKCIARGISNFLLSSSKDPSRGCSTFLPAIPAAQSDPSRLMPSRVAPLVAVDMAVRCDRMPDTNIIKHDPSRLKNRWEALPLTSGHWSTASEGVLGDLDLWLESRPKTSPEKTGRNKSSYINATRGRPQKGPSTLPLPPPGGPKSGLVFGLGSDEEDSGKGLPPVPTPVKKRSVEKEEPNLDAMKSSSSPNTAAHSSQAATSKPSEDMSRTKRLVRSRKKRCSHCSKKTGLASSFLCRCGRNFCASHRYAETHGCTFDYKTEGRRLLQMSNPVVAAPKLPKI